ncbi:MAG: hypothetical protein ACI9MR_003980 [Myxococcota bacterium]|jgi:hypothetical protein
MIWWYALGYFAAYVPYSALTKATSAGWIDPTMAVPGPTILPLSVAVSTVGMFTFLWAMGWFKYAGRRTIFGRSVPMPSQWPLLSGLSVATIIVTTTLAYTFEGISIIFAMLLMRGGLLLLAPVIDVLTGREVKWNALLASGFALSALVVAFADSGQYTLSTEATVTIAIYLSAYFLRLQLMTRVAKTTDRAKNLRFFAEEQMTATPVVLLVLIIVATLGTGGFADQIGDGFTTIWSSGPTIILAVIGIGLFSQFTGIFGGLVLLDPAPNAFCVPVNRSSSILAGVAATYALSLLADGNPPTSTQLIGAGLVVVAILCLSYPLLAARLAQRREATSPD